MLSNPFARLVGGAWLLNVLVFLAALAVYATSFMMVAAVVSEAIATAFALVAVAAAAWGFSRFGASIDGAMNAISQRVGRLSVTTIVVLGLVLRLAWIGIFPAQPGSDGATYLALGRQLLAGEPYEMAGTRAYWPPGYPMFLAAWLALPGSDRFAYLLANLAVYVAGALGVARLAASIGTPSTGKFAALLFAVWPNLVTQVGTPEKEPLVIALLAWATYFVYQVIQKNRVGPGAFAAGVLLGAATLVQPSLQFLPLAAVALLLILAGFTRAGVLGGIALVLATGLTVAPWTLRNQQVLGSPVLVATNGGDNLYRANNPMATGGYTPRGEVDLSSYDELERDQIGRQLAFEWIRANPKDFLELAVTKQIRFMGDDAVGVYTTLKVGGGTESSAVYAAAKSLSNLWWMIVWCAIGALALIARREGGNLPHVALALVWVWLYLYVLHAIFESAGKYHVPVLWVPCVLLAVLATRSRAGVVG